MIKTDHHINKNLATLLFTIFLDFLGFGIVIPVIAPVLIDPVNGILHTGYSMQERTFILGLLIAAFPAAQFFGAPILGAYSDKFGRKKILLISILATSISLFLFGIGISTKSIFLLFFSRVLNGFMGGNVSTAQSAIADMSDLQSKAKNFGMMGMMFGLGFILGPFIGGKLSDFHSYNWLTFSTPFWVAGVLSLVNVLLVARWFEETLLNKRSDVKINFSTGLKNIRHAISIPNLRSIFIVSFLIIFGFTSFTQFFQVYLISKFNFTQAHLGMVFGYLGLWIAITQGAIVRIIAKKYSPSSILRVSIPSLSIAVFALLIPQQEFLIYFILPFVAMAQGASTPNITAMISNSAHKDEQGEILGINQSIQSVGFALPPVLSGIIAAYDIRLPIVVGSIFIFASWIYFLYYYKRATI